MGSLYIRTRTNGSEHPRPRDIGKVVRSFNEWVHPNDYKFLSEFVHPNMRAFSQYYEFLRHNSREIEGRFSCDFSDDAFPDLSQEIAATLHLCLRLLELTAEIETASSLEKIRAAYVPGRLPPVHFNRLQAGAGRFPLPSRPPVGLRFPLLPIRCARSGISRCLIPTTHVGFGRSRMLRVGRRPAESTVLPLQRQTFKNKPARIMPILGPSASCDKPAEQTQLAVSGCFETQAILRFRRMEIAHATIHVRSFDQRSTYRSHKCIIVAKRALIFDRQI